VNKLNINIFLIFKKSFQLVMIVDTRWLSRYLDQNGREILEKLISSKEFKLTYFNYDWLVNAPQ
jgi:hypothetical protein